MIPLLVLQLLGNRFASNRDWLAIEVVALFDSREFEQRRNDVGVRGDYLNCLTFGYIRAADIEWNIDVFFEGACFAGLEPMLSDMVTIVGREDDVSVIQEVVFFQAIDDLVH